MPEWTEIFVLERVWDAARPLANQPMVFEERKVPGLLWGPVSLHQNAHGFHVTLQKGPMRGKRIGSALESFETAWKLFALSARALGPEGALDEKGVPQGPALAALQTARKEV
jgi:hypothetical protein